MRQFLIGTVAGGVLATTAAALAWTVQTQRFPQFENDTVKAWRTVIAPGVPTALHRHDHPRVVVVLAGGPMDFPDDKGTHDRKLWETGKAYYLSAMPPSTLHQDVNTGNKPIEVMVVELEKEK